MFWLSALILAFAIHFFRFWKLLRPNSWKTFSWFMSIPLKECDRNPSVSTRDWQGFGSPLRTLLSKKPILSFQSNERVGLRGTYWFFGFCQTISWSDNFWAASTRETLMDKAWHQIDWNLPTLGLLKRKIFIQKGIWLEGCNMHSLTWITIPRIKFDLMKKIIFFKINPLEA